MSTPIPNSTPTATVIPNPNPTTPNYPDDIQWITAYLVIHMLSPGSFWYAYLLWFVVAAIFLLYIFLRWTGSGGYLGARWNKWALRKRTWRGQHALAIAKKRGTRPQPTSLPSNGQIFCMIVLFVAVLLLCFVGPDYIGRSHSSIFARRDGRRPAYSISDFIHLQPQYQINKAWWTSGNRTGVLAFALLPLCVLFALKAPPFALFAIPFTTQFYFDKLSWLHRWSGRLIWMVSALHVLLWSVQLSLDRREGTGVAPYVYIWRYPKFIYGWTVCYLFLTTNLPRRALTPHLLGIYDNDRTHWTFHFVSEEAVLPSVLRLPYTARPSHHNHGRSTSPSCLVVVLGCFESLGRGAYMESNLVALQQRFSGVIIRPHFQSHETRRLLSRSALRRGQAPHLPSVTVVVWNGCHRGFAVPQLRRRALIHTSTRLFLC